MDSATGQDDATTSEDADTVTNSVLFPDLSLFENASDDDSEPEQPSLSPWAKTKIGTFQARLELVLEKRELRGLAKFGMRSVSSALLINMVNECFGFNGWSSQILECRVESEDFDTENSVFSMAQVAIVRIVLNDGTEVEATGHGEARGLPSKHLCLGTSRKMACTDGLRNAFLKFPELLRRERSIKIEPDMSEIP